MSAAPSYLRSIVTNLVRTDIRRRITERLRPPSPVRETGEDVDGNLAVLQAVARLPARQRACVVLRYYEDGSEADTAAALGISIGAVKSQTHKALRRLERMLEGS